MNKLLFPDTLHFHDRNFKSLMDLIKEKKINAIFVKEYNELKALYGNYKEVKTLFLEEYDELSKLSLNDLFKKKMFGVQLFSLCKAELLSYLMAQPNWFSQDISSNAYAILVKAFEENTEELLLNMAVTMFWLKYWKNKLKGYKQIDSCIVFSGSLIYTKTLSFLLQNTSIRVFVVEHFFTGNDFYLEEKYTHIANNSDVKFDNYYKQLKDMYLEEDLFNQEKEKIKAINKIRMANNKNVQQPSKADINFPFTENGEKTVLILGQVINDFSIIETNLSNLNSLQIYKEIITKVIKETNYNIIFKAHPWERNKINLKSSLTKDELTKYISRNFSTEEQLRIQILEDFNIYSLFANCEYIIGLCSQSLIEAAYHGKKPHQIGKAFFEKKGFTYDHVTVTDFITTIKDSSCVSNLSIAEYNELILFLTLFLQYHAVSIFPSGKKSILHKLSMKNMISIIANNTDNSLLPSVCINDNDIEESAENVAVLRLPTNYEQSSEKISTNSLIEYLVLNFSSDRKFKKFKSNPKKYFYDSKYPFIRIFGKFY